MDQACAALLAAVAGAEDVLFAASTPLRMWELTSSNVSSRVDRELTAFPSWGVANSFSKGALCQSQGLRMTGMTAALPDS